MRSQPLPDDGPPIRLPVPPAALLNPAAFVLLPVPGTPLLWAWQIALYQHCLEQAQAVVRTSILERDLLGVWN